MGKKWEDFFPGMWYNVAVKHNRKGDLLMERKQFTFYRSFFESIQRLKTKNERLQAYEMLCRYALDGEMPDEKETKDGVLAIFSIARPIIIRARQRSSAALQRASLAQQDKV